MWILNINSRKVQFISIILFILISCSSDPDLESFENSPFWSTILEDKDEFIVEELNFHQLNEYEIYLPMHPRRDAFGNFVIVDGNNWNISLINNDGELLDRVGGTGKGPGEFVAINHIELTDENKFYTLDLVQNRITVYNITNETFQIDKIFNVDVEAIGGSLTSFYEINQRWWGVKRTSGFDKQFSLVELDSLFKPIKTHLELPKHFPEIFLQNRNNNIKWAKGENTFNYVFYDSLIIYSYDVVTGSLNRYPLNKQHLSRDASPLNKKYIEEAYKNSQGEIQELHQLAYLAGDKDYIFSNVVHFGEEATIIFGYNLPNGKIKYIVAPPQFFLHDVDDHFVTGIADGQLISIKFID